MAYLFLASNLGLLLLAAFSAHRLFAYLTDREERHLAEREAYTQHLGDLCEQIVSLTLSHRGEVAQLNQARMEETANLLQRIQAPEQAVTSHVANQAGPDPPPVNLESDDELLALYESRVKEFVDG